MGALTEYLTEQEQIELLKSWIKQYSLVILAGVFIAIIAITGWRYWQQRQIKALSHASIAYDEMLTMRAQNNPAATVVQAKKLFKHYPKTTYGNVAALMLAREAINSKNYPEGEKYLQWVIDHGRNASFRQIAQLRLARLLIAENKPKAAIHILDKVTERSFSGLIDEVRGDAYVNLGDKKMAKDAYSRALNELPNAEVIRPLLQMKYDNLS
jgi:predicted negative regulator of RcsB-dependent stress response